MHVDTAAGGAWPFSPPFSPLLHAQQKCAVPKAAPAGQQTCFLA